MRRVAAIAVVFGRVSKQGESFKALQAPLWRLKVKYHDIKSPELDRSAYRIRIVD